MLRKKSISKVDPKDFIDLVAPTQEVADAGGEGFLPQLTLRMRARLQGFPDWWDFAGGKDSTARQVGNAVPPAIGQAIGLAVRSALAGERYDYSRMLEASRYQRPDPQVRAFVSDAPSLEPDLRGKRFDAPLPSWPKNELDCAACHPQVTQTYKSNSA
ncbi:DNA cytosine methyltransferase [Pararhizobium sp. LjRoot238]|uniref:DNA cytosine methyltransferase n=1 Tax=Pararhizobium sp. LjRoot238 TaxID=3342293 RepID=UPI003ECE4091